MEIIIEGALTNLDNEDDITISIDDWELIELRPPRYRYELH